ncbi:hypothetical protein PHYSODRAFT_501398, partial [Phytophthora sojae]
YKWAMRTVFHEKKLIKIMEGSIVKSGLSTAEKKEAFDEKQTQIMHMVGTSMPRETLHQNGATRKSEARRQFRRSQGQGQQK